MLMQYLVRCIVAFFLFFSLKLIIIFIITMTAQRLSKRSAKLEVIQAQCKAAEGYPTTRGASFILAQCYIVQVINPR